MQTAVTDFKNKYVCFWFLYNHFKVYLLWKIYIISGKYFSPHQPIILCHYSNVQFLYKYKFIYMKIDITVMA